MNVLTKILVITPYPPVSITPVVSCVAVIPVISGIGNLKIPVVAKI